MTFHLDDTDIIDPIDPDEFIRAVETLRLALIIAGRNPQGVFITSQHPAGTFAMPSRRLTRDEAIELIKTLNTQRTSYAAT